MIERALCEAVFREAVVACDPAARVAEALARTPLQASRRVFGLAIGKAALAMARGAGPVKLGIAITNVDDGGALPDGWRLVVSDHPTVGAKSLEAGKRAMELVDCARADDVVLALISGGASSLCEVLGDGVTVDAYRARIQQMMASGARIRELNRVRTELSAIKGGRLAAQSKAPVVTLVVSDVIGDDPMVVGSGPTVRRPLGAGDRVEIIAPMATFGHEVARAFKARGVEALYVGAPLAGDVADVAHRLVRDDFLNDQIDADRVAAGELAQGEHLAQIAWGEPTVRVPEHHGVGGRAQQLALELARRLRGAARAAFVAGSDGIDGPSPRGAAGAFVDGTTWDAIVAAGIDPDAALRRCDAGTALDAVGALVITGPTGINHADIMIVG